VQLAMSTLLLTKSIIPHRFGGSFEAFGL
jgi:hypothetical protein